MATAEPTEVEQVKLPESRRRRVGLLLLVAALVVAWIVLDPFPEIDAQELLDDVARGLGDWTYLLVGALAFLETGAFVGLVFPGETAVILGGAVAGQGEISIELMLGIVWFCAWAGDSVSFLIGQRLGRDFVLRHGPKVRITRERFGQVERYFKRHGGKTILIGRFIGLVRALAPFIAGSSGMRYRAFLPFSVLGTGLWAAAFSLLGFFLSRSINEATEIAGRGTLVFAVTVAAIAGVVVAVRWLRVAENRERLAATLEGNPVTRPLLALARRLEPQARFVWNRLTPGALGLELTALLAVLAVALYVFLAYLTVLAGDPAPTAGDAEALDLARDLQAGWLTDLAEVVSSLGAPAVSLAVGGLAGLALAVRRHWAEVAVLVIAMAIVVVGVGVIKDVVDRPRPPGGLIDTKGSGFPSGHAAYSAVYPSLAVAFVVRLRPGLTSSSAIVVVGIILAATIGLTRVYLRAHYLSDVAAGWGLGVSAFAACAMVALVVGHLRQNGPP